MAGLMHLTMREPSAFWLIRALHEMGVSVDSTDYQNRTPFSIGVDHQISFGTDLLPKSLEMLMENGVNIDCADQALQTPFLKLYNARM